MDYCAPRGIAHSTFLAWDESDQDKALWWLLRDRQRCKGCGTHPDDWTPALGGARDAYDAAERVCPGCQRSDVETEALEKARGRGEPKYGAQIVLIRNNPYDDEESSDG